MVLHTVEAAVIWTLVGIALWKGRPDLAQPLAMLGTALVNALLNRKDKDREAQSPRSFSHVIPRTPALPLNRYRPQGDSATRHTLPKRARYV